MGEHWIVVPRTARYYTLGEVSPATREVWVVLHGYAQLAEHFLRWFRQLDDGSRLVVAPEGLSRFYRAGAHGHIGASWMTAVDREAEIADYVGYLDAIADTLLRPTNDDSSGAEAPRLVVLGFSQGAATAARWACRGRHPVDALVLWGGHVPPEIDLVQQRDRLRGLRLVLGSRDEYRDETALARERGRLEAAAIVYEAIDFDGTHRVESEPLMRMAASIRSEHVAP